MLDLTDSSRQDDPRKRTKVQMVALVWFRGSLSQRETIRQARRHWPLLARLFECAHLSQTYVIP
jgi:hypothetical protein